MTIDAIKARIRFTPEFGNEIHIEIGNLITKLIRMRNRKDTPANRREAANLEKRVLGMIEYANQTYTKKTA